MWITDKFLLGFMIVALASTVSHAQSKREKAVFAGGCFWCMTAPFEKLNGVISVVSGYTGGEGADPTYEDYARKGHIEAVEVTYDPSRITYRALLDVFWKQIDPIDAGGQFCDRGAEYRSAIFYQNDEQRLEAQMSKDELDRSGRLSQPAVTELIKASAFYKAEDYHQDYYKKSPVKYKFYRFSCGRDQRLQNIWGKQAEIKSPAGEEGRFMKPSRDELKKRLTPMQFRVTQENGTEPAFRNEYWDEHRDGIYVDIVSGEPLFSSIDQYDSKTGWPSFTRPLEPGNIVEKRDISLFGVRTEIRSKLADSHLGHVFRDGPPPTGLRYCMNSAALRFIPKEDLEKEGLGQYQAQFEEKK